MTTTTPSAATDLYINHAKLDWFNARTYGWWSSLTEALTRAEPRDEHLHGIHEHQSPHAQPLIRQRGI